MESINKNDLDHLRKELQRFNELLTPQKHSDVKKPFNKEEFKMRFRAWFILKHNKKFANLN